MAGISKQRAGRGAAGSALEANAPTKRPHDLADDWSNAASRDDRGDGWDY